MKYLSKHVATWLIRCGAIDEMDRELYEYAVYSFIFLIAPLAIILTFGIMMDRVLESIIIIIPFMCVRKFSGGFHAKHVWVCILCSCSVLFMCVYMVTNIKYIFVLNICVVLAVTSLIILSPIDSESRKLDEGEIVGKGTHEELMKHCTVYQEIAKSQMSAKELGLTDGEEGEYHE